MTSVACSDTPSSGASTDGNSNGAGAGNGSAGRGTAGAQPTSGAGSAGSGVASSGSANGGDATNASGGSAGSALAGGAGAGGAGAGAAGTGASSAGAGGVGDTVTRTSSKFSFQHYPSETNASNVWSGPATPGSQLSTTSYDTVVLENGYLKVTLLPAYGGRILSIIHKPTGRELLYQNPIGTPYLMQQDIFYYDYLVIMGGIFPSFPEPEHGKYWNMPYQFAVVSESPEAITVRLSRKDDQELAAGVPTRYDVGRTDVLVELDITLRAGRSDVQLDTKLTNTRTTAVPKFEYWTVTTLAPGSTPGQAKITANARIIAKMAQVHLLESSWAWFGKAEERVSGEVFKWKNLSHFENWVDQGTAFASPNYQADWSGLINYDNDTGILCVTDHVATPGLKLWTFGKDSLSANLQDSTEWLRPTIEMWHGITPEFWNRATLAAGEVRKSSAHYFATLGAKEITSASEYGALSLSRSSSGTNTVLSAVATLTVPNQTVKAILRLGSDVIAEKDVSAEASKPTTVDVSLPTTGVAAGALFTAEFRQGDRSLLSGQIALE